MSAVQQKRGLKGIALPVEGLAVTVHVPVPPAAGKAAAQDSVGERS